jgi:predicted metal-dependent hydrolase
MSSAVPEYEPRYLAGVVLFNRRDFFEAHEVWESLWLDACVGNDRRFVQALIQAAVGLYHFGNGNRSGAKKLYKSSKAYMDAYPSSYLGLDTAKFWRDMERCFAELHGAIDEKADIRPEPDLIPRIALDPQPAAWPDPAQYLDEEE